MTTFLTLFKFYHKHSTPGDHESFPMKSLKKGTVLNMDRKIPNVSM